MKTLLVIGYVWPEPNSSAAGSRMLQVLAAFQQQGYHITYASPAEDSLHAVSLAELGIEKATIELNSASFDAFVQTLNPSAVLFDRFMMEEQFGWRVAKHCPNALRILDTEDLHCLRRTRHQALKQKRPWQQQDLNTEVAHREIAAILRCDLTLMISEYEMELLQTYFNVDARLLSYTPFMLQANEAHSRAATHSSLAFAQRQHFISIGNFRHEPNWDAVLHLKQALWPAIRKQLPKAELHIYGGYPPKKATQLHNEQQGFLVKGWAESADAVIGQARVLLAPLRFGAGLKGKLLDAARLGTPAVTTSIGAEGMYGDAPQKPSLVAEDDDAFIAHAVSLYQQADLWQRLHQAGPQIIERRFAFAEHATALMARVEAIANNLTGHRQCNFYGAMLQHHSMKSTQYMAQWIEAKNKNSQQS